MASLIALSFMFAAVQHVQAQVEAFLGEIRMFAGNFAPRDWAFCDGQLLPINLNSSLFALLGTTFGGDGRTNFALPDLRGRVPLHPGSGPGLTIRDLGEKGGAEAHSLIVNEIPSHSHPANAYSLEGSSAAPQGGVWAKSGAGDPDYHSAVDTTMSGSAIGNTGGGQPHNNMQPYLGVNFIICLEGTFPSRP